MEALKFNQYYNCISSLKSEEMIDAFTASIYPDLKDSRRREIHRKVSRNIGKIIERKHKTLADFGSTMEKMKALISGR